MDEALTVVIPVYNEEKAIAGTLEELLPYARRHHWKLIVVDDGSTDDGPNTWSTTRSEVSMYSTICSADTDKSEPVLSNPCSAESSGSKRFTST